MPVPFLSSITLNKNEVQDFKVFNYAGDVTPLTGTDIGYFWTNTTGGKTLRWWDGSAVRTVLDTSSSISGSQISGNITGGSGFVANALTAGSYLTSGGTFDGSVARTFAVDATDANTASKIVARDASGNFSAGTITASLSGNATTATTATTATNVAGGAAGELLYQSGLATTAKLGVGTDGYILTYDGTNTKPKWSASIPAGSVSGLAASATTDTTNAANITSGLLPLARLALATGQFYVGDASNNPAATAKSSISLTGFGALTADLDIAGFNIINSGNVTSGSSGSTLATKGYVDSVAQGLDIKASCLVASTADINLSAPGSGLIDGIDPATFTSGTTRILVKDQSLSQQNGIYIWNGTGSAMTRSLDANTWDELVGAFTFIETGTANADSGWVCTANAGGTLGTTPVPFVKFSQAGSYTAGNGMVLSGGVFHFAQDTNYTAGRIPFASGNTTIGFNANLFWDNTNNRLGIGTASPADPLDVNGASTLRGNITIASGSTSYGTLWVTSNTLELQSNSNATSGLRFKTTSATPVVFATNGSDKLTLDTNGYLYTAANGRIGVGIIPIAPLHVYVAGASERASILAHMGGGDEAFRLVARNGSGGAVGNVESARFGLERDAVWNAGFRFFRGGSGTDGYLIASTSGTDRLTLDASGNLGLGVPLSAHSAGRTAFQMPAGVIEGAAGELNILNNAYLATAGWTKIANGSATMFRSTGAEFKWYQAGAGTGVFTWTQAMTLTAAGELLVGATSPSTASVTVEARKDQNSASRILTINQNSGASALCGIDLQAFGGGWQIDVPASTTFVNPLLFKFNGTERLRIDSSGNLGLGVTPKVWYSGYKSIQVGQGPCITGYASAGNESEIFFGANAYVGASGASWQYLANGQASQYWQKQGNHYWRTAANNTSGADANISWGDPKMTLDASGNLGVGIAPATSTRRLIVYGSTAAATNTALALQTSTSGTTGTDGFTMELDGTTAYLWNYENNAILFGTNNAERLRIKSTGQLNLVGLNSAPTGAVGDLYYNSTSNTLQYHNNSAFQQISRKYSTALAGTNTSFTVTHNFGTRDVTVQVRKSGSTYDLVYTDVQMTTTDTVTVIFASSVTGSDYTVTVIG